MADNNKGCGAIIVWVIGIALGLFILVYLSKIFVYVGYNTLFFTDNLVEIAGVDPIISWGILGLFIGGIAGVAVAIKKYRLPGKLILFPISFTILFVVIMYSINKPMDYSGTFTGLESRPTFANPTTQNYKTYYRTTVPCNLRAGPSLQYQSLYVIGAYAEVEVLQKGIYDTRNVEWYRVLYNYHVGYVSTKNLQFSRNAY